MDVTRERKDNFHTMSSHLRGRLHLPAPRRTPPANTADCEWSRSRGCSHQDCPHSDRSYPPHTGHTWRPPHCPATHQQQPPSGWKARDRWSADQPWWKAPQSIASDWNQMARLISGVHICLRPVLNGFLEPQLKSHRTWNVHHVPFVKIRDTQVTECNELDELAERLLEMRYLF